MASTATNFSLDGIDEPAHLVHHGRRSRRWRFRLESFRQQPLVAEEIRARLLGDREVSSVEIDVRSGSLLIVTRGACLPSMLRELRRTVAVSSPRPAPTLWRHLADRARPSTATPAPATDGWHSRAVDEVCALVHTSPRGLTSAEARRRLLRDGHNVLDEERTRSRARLIAAQLANVPTAILLGSSALSALIGELVDTMAILTVVTINASIGYVVERTNERLIASWRHAEAGETQVLRDGAPRPVSASELAVGDVVLLRGGDVVPADARVLSAHRLACDEAPLTGESEPQLKSRHAVARDAPLAERSCMVYAGTTVVSGHGRAVVVATATGTEVAHVRGVLERTAAPQAPLARRLNRLSTRVARASLVGAATAMAAGIVHRRPLIEVLRSGVALGVAALPEGLPVVSTAALVRSMARMRRAGMVVRRLSAAETLGGITVICTDKTGTLTENRMNVEVVDIGSGARPIADVRAVRGAPFGDRATLLLLAALLNSDVEVQHRGRDILSITGSSTEQALVRAAHRAGLDTRELRRQFPLESLTERSENTQYVLSLHAAPDGRKIELIKGAPEQVARLCGYDGLDRRRRRRSPRARDILAANERLAGDGLRVLAVGWREVGDDAFRYLGLVGLRDPLRESALDTIRAAREAGIRTVILTGDQKRTAKAIARRLDLDGEALDGAEVVDLARSTDPRAQERLRRMSVISRVTPADKLSIVEALRRQGEIVAMVGDGINDAPALKAADVAIAVGRNATDLARHVADVVLEGDDLRSIVAAVAEGRIVQDNLRRAIRFLFATNLSELALVIAAAVVGAPDPLTPLQLLWINLLTDTIPALALALEPGDPNVLDRPPAPPSAPLLAPALRRRILIDGAIMAVSSAAASIVGGRAVGFGVLSGAQLAYTLACRAGGPTPSPRFDTLMSATVLTQMVALTWEPLKRILSVAATGAGPLLGFALGFLIPLVVRRLGQADTIVRRGRDELPCPSPVALQIR